jgi:hypothetical protein
MADIEEESECRYVKAQPLLSMCTSKKVQDWRRGIRPLTFVTVFIGPQGQEALYFTTYIYVTQESWLLWWSPFKYKAFVYSN